MPGYRSVCYYCNWSIYGRKHRPQDLPVDKLTHVLYSFANVRPESGEVYLTDAWADLDIHWEGDSWNDSGTNMYGCMKQLNIHKARNRNLKVLLSIGGWSYKENFAAPASTANGRQTFARTAVQLLKDIGLDGLDIDWEYPKTPEQAEHFVQLLKAVRTELDKYSATLSQPYHFELSIATPAGPQKNILKIREMDRFLDFWNIMSYDYSGSWSAVSGHQANLYKSKEFPAATELDTASVVEYYIRHGVNAHKVVVGMPLYGRAFENTKNMGQPYRGVGTGSWEPGSWDYKDLPRPGSQELFDASAVASYCRDSAKGTIVTYETVKSAKAKAQYIKDFGLGGAMWWESSGDKKGEQSIISAVVKTFGGSQALLKHENCLNYPKSKYDNLRNGKLRG